MAWEEWVVAHARTASKPHKKIGMDDKLAFFDQLATLVSSGTPLLQSLRIAADQSESLDLRTVLQGIATQVSTGSSFNGAAREHPKIFEHTWVEVIRVGEVTGKMQHVLVELSKQVRESRATQQKVRAALTYPVILLCVAALAMTAMLMFVVPTFKQMFDDMGAELPEITQVVVNLSDYVVDYGPYVAGGIVVSVVAFRKYNATENGRRNVDNLLIVMPTLGDLLVMAMMYRFASSISLLLNSGVPMLETLTTLRGIFNKNPMYRDALGHAQQRVSAGRSLADSLEETGLFTSMIVSMVRTGESSGQLGPVMETIAPFYKEKMEGLITKVSKMLEPIIILGMGSGVATMMLSIYMPMFEMSGKIN